MESVPYFTEENFHLVNLLNEITKGKIPPVESLVNAATRPSETGAAPSGSASPSMKSMILDFSDISKELKRSYEDLVIFYEEEHGRLTGQNGGSKKQTRSGSLTLLATPDDFDMEAKSLTRKFSNMQKIMQKCDDCDFRGIIEEISMRKAQQRFLGALKELFIVYEQLLQDETDSLDFLLITEDPVELLKGAKLLAKLYALTLKPSKLPQAPASAPDSNVPDSGAGTAGAAESGKTSAATTLRTFSLIQRYYDAFEKRIVMFFKNSTNTDDSSMTETFSKIIVALKSVETCK